MFSLSASPLAIEEDVEAAGWLRSRTFDFNLILSVAAIALLAGAVSLLQPGLFKWVLILDLWLLGYHHVVSTFTRLVFDRDSFRQHRFLVIQLPVIVLVATLSAVLLLGLWVLPTVYLYWQWFHYTRQSYGIERAYRRKAGEDKAINDYATTRALYLVPVFGILYRSYQASPTFLGMHVAYLPVHWVVLAASGLIAAAAVVYWMAHVVLAMFRGQLAFAHTLYMLTHQIVFMAGYLLIADITTGWLVLNVWHNAQYILFVWWSNNKRFDNCVDERHRFLSTICQRHCLIAYFGICIAISTVAYVAISLASVGFGGEAAITVTLIATMVLNFHHYVVDGIIWKRRRQKPPQIAEAAVS